MTELKEAVFGGEFAEKAGNMPVSKGADTKNITDSLKESIESLEKLEISASRPAAETSEEKLRASMSKTEQMKQDIAADNARLEKRAAAERRDVHTAEAKTKETHKGYSVGILSAGVSLLFMGIVFLTTLNSPTGSYAALKLSPMMLIFLGAELVFVVFRNKTLKVVFDIKSIVVTAVLIVLSASLMLISAVSTSNGDERSYARERISNMLAGELHEKISNDYVKSVDIEVNLYGENAEMYNTPADLTDGDMINLSVNFSDAQMPIRDFAKDCRKIMDSVFTLRYNFGTIKFIADDGINLYTLNIDCMYQSDFSADRLAALVNYFGDEISDTDIPDIE